MGTVHITNQTNPVRLGLSRVGSGWVRWEVESASLMATAAYQIRSGQFATDWNNEDSEEYSRDTFIDPAVLARNVGFYSRVQERWAASLLSGSLFEPTGPDLDQRGRVEQLVGVLVNLRRKSERHRSFLRGGRS